MRLNHYLFDRLFVSRLGEENPHLPQIMREQPEMMHAFLRDLAEATLHYELYNTVPDEFVSEYPDIEPVRFPEEVSREMRILAKNRFGKKYDARSVIAMAMFRNSAREITGEEIVGEHSHKFMHQAMLDWLEEKPLR